MTVELCVLAHGFTGSPAELQPLAHALQDAGYEVVNPLLHGHGGTRDDLRKATTSHWLQSVEPIIANNVAIRPVHLVGFSMGSMIMAVMAARYPVASITMLAPAVHYVSSRALFRQMAGLIKSTWNFSQAARTSLRDQLDNLAQTPVQSLQQFRRIVQLGKAALPNVTVPLCILQGELDEVVEPRSAEFAFNHAASTRKEVHYLPSSGHMLCEDVEADVVIDRVLQFLASLERVDLDRSSGQQL